MAYNEKLADKIRDQLKGISNIQEKKMFGGLCILIKGNMSLGIVENKLMVRVGKENYEKALLMPGASPMDFTGKALRGMVYVNPAMLSSPKILKKWVQMGVQFAQSLPPKRPKQKRT